MDYIQEVLHLCHSIIFCGPECISVVAALVCGLQPKGEVVTWGTEQQLEGGMGVGGKRKEGREREKGGEMEAGRRDGRRGEREKRSGSRRHEIFSSTDAYVHTLNTHIM